MAISEPRGPRTFDLGALSADDFEELCFRLIRLEALGAHATDNPDGGADVLLTIPGGGFSRAWQAKHYPNRIHWAKCIESLDRAVSTYAVNHLTFCFPRNLTRDQQRHFDTQLVRRHAAVVVDFWDLGEIQARLCGSEGGLRVARSYFTDPAEDAALIVRAVRAGGKLEGTEDAAERAAPIAEFLEGHDAFFSYPLHTFEAGHEAPPTPGSLFSMLRGEGKNMCRIDAVPRDPEAAARYSPRLRLEFGADEEGRRRGERLQEALSRGCPITVSGGVRATFTRLPPAFANQVGISFDAEITLRPGAEPWPAEFRVRGASGETSVRMTMEPITELDSGWDCGFAGHFGGLRAAILVRLGKGEEAVAITWSHRIDGSAARDQLAAIDFLTALTQEGEFILRECDEGTWLMREPNVPEVPDERLPLLSSLLTDVVEIEDWVGFEVRVPSEISAEEIATIATAADFIRSRQAPLEAPKFCLVGSPAAIPQLAGGKEIAISELAVIEVFGREIELGRRTVRLPGAEVVDFGEVEPGRHEIELTPVADVEASSLRWELEPPEPLTA